ncbi:MAG TPA: hypothetical protein VHD81_05955 [Mycobacteriales bacterium]|nr:hypothetical protein [Mycobacteriales bacterium]
MTTDPGGAPAPAPDPMAALVDIRNQVIRLGQEVAAMRAEQPAASPDAMNSVTAELREAVRFLAERLDGVARMVAQRGEELADTRGALGAIDAHVRSQAETIGVLTTGMQALPTYGAQVAGLQDNLNTLLQRLGNLEGALGQRLGGIEQAVARPTDASVSERLSAIEGMLGPLAQRLAQAHSDHAASLQSLHGKIEAVATGTQAALAQPVAGGDSAVAALEPKLAGLSTEIQTLRSDVAAVIAARSSSEGGEGGAPVDLSPLAMQITQLSGELQSLRSDVASVVAARAGSEGGAADGGGAPVDLSPISSQLSDLSDQLTQLAAAAPAPGAPAVTGDSNVDAAILAAEQRLMAHVDDAIFALAQTLLGRGHAAAALVDVPAPPQESPEPAPSPAAVPTPLAAAAADAADEYDETDVDEAYDDEGYDDDDEADAAEIDFSRAEIDDEDEDTVSWERPAHNEVPAPQPGWGRPPQPSHAGGSQPPAPGTDAPFDQDAGWGTPPLSGPTEGQSTVVPERRRRWFSW